MHSEIKTITIQTNKVTMNDKKLITLLNNPFAKVAIIATIATEIIIITIHYITL